MSKNARRPVFLDLTRIHLPVTAVISIVHRITGVLFFLFIPLLVYVFELSLSSQQGYETVSGILDRWPVRLVVVVMLWGFAHHFLAGIRYLLIDIDIGVGRESSRVSAWCVVAGGVMVLFSLAFVLL